MERPRNKLPERIEISERRAVRMKMVRRGVMNIGCDPYRIGDRMLFYVRQYFGDFVFTAKWGPIVAVGKLVIARAWFLFDMSNWKRVGNDFPLRPGL